MAAATNITYNEGRGAVIVTGRCTLDPGSIAAGSRETETIAVPGVKVGDICFASPQAALSNGLVIAQVACYADGTISVRVENHTAGAVDHGSGVWNWGYIRGQQQIGWAG